MTRGKKPHFDQLLGPQVSYLEEESAALEPREQVRGEARQWVDGDPYDYIRSLFHPLPEPKRPPGVADDINESAESVSMVWGRFQPQEPDAVEYFLFGFLVVRQFFLTQCVMAVAGREDRDLVSPLDQASRELLASGGGAVWAVGVVVEYPDIAQCCGQS